MKPPKSSRPSTEASSRPKPRGRGRPPKEEGRKKKFLKCFVTDPYKLEVERYCAERDLTVSRLIYELLVQIVPDPEA